MNYNKKLITILLFSTSSGVFAQQKPVDAGGVLLNEVNKNTSMYDSFNVLPKPVLKKEESKSSANQPDSSIKITPKEFVIRGNKNIPTDVIQDLLASLLNKECSYSDLAAATDTIIAYYRSKGLLVQATLPPQKIINGVIYIYIVEGVMAPIKIEQPNGETRLTPDRAKKYLEEGNQAGEPFNVDVFSGAMQILNEVPGTLASSKLVSGKTEGEVEPVIALTENSVFNGQLSVDNYGSASTGQNEVSANLGLANPLGYGDSARIFALGTEGLQYQYLEYNFPLGYDGLRANLNASNLQYKNIGNFATNGSKGDSQTFGGKLSLPLIRETYKNVNTELTFTNKNFKNEYLSTGGISSQYTTNSITVSLNGNQIDSFLNGGQSYGQIGLTGGQFIVDSASPANYNKIGSVSITPSSYSKISLSANRLQNIDSNYKINIALQGQYSNQNLNSSDQIYLGGAYGVRAYPQSQGGGISGLLTRIDFSRALIDNQLYGKLFYDFGLVRQYANNETFNALKGLTNANNTYSISGVGLGFDYNYSNFITSSVWLAQPIGTNPLYTYSGKQLNVDNKSSASTRIGVNASVLF